MVTKSELMMRIIDLEMVNLRHEEMIHDLYMEIKPKKKTAKKKRTK